MRKIILVAVILSVSLIWFSAASATEGTIDSEYKYAWSENAGWINFGTAEGNVHITDSELTGHAWGENIGWISLNCSNNTTCGVSNYKVSNDGEGNLSGYAWAENAGWINFNPTYGGVSINFFGEFLGYAWGENIGWIVFNCATTNSCSTVDYKVKTDWQTASSRTAPAACNDSMDNDGDGKIDYPDDPGCSSSDDNNETDVTPAKSKDEGLLPQEEEPSTEPPSSLGPLEDKSEEPIIETIPIEKFNWRWLIFFVILIAGITIVIFVRIRRKR